MELCSLGGGDVPFWGVEMCQIWGVEMCLDEVIHNHLDAPNFFSEDLKHFARAKSLHAESWLIF